jgi:hypothetical protein
MVARRSHPSKVGMLIRRPITTDLHGYGPIRTRPLRFTPRQNALFSVENMVHSNSPSMMATGKSIGQRGRCQVVQRVHKQISIYWRTSARFFKPVAAKPLTHHTRDIGRE